MTHQAIKDALKAVAARAAEHADGDEIEREYAWGMLEAVSLMRPAIDSLLAELEEAKRDAASKQAQIDRLMLEYCPDEMTPEQFENWARHQVAASSAPTLESLRKVFKGSPDVSGNAAAIGKEQSK